MGFVPLSCDEYPDGPKQLLGLPVRLVFQVPSPLLCLSGGRGVGYLKPVLGNGYLVDPASSHMLVSKIKPCMSKYKRICTVKLRMAH